MNPTNFSTALIIYLVATLLVPVLRHRFKRGEWPMTFHRNADPFQRLIGGLFALLLCAGALWAFFLWQWPTDRLGIWDAPAWLGMLGLGLLMGGGFLEIASQITMEASFRVGIDDRPTELVTGGVFRVIRNPIFSGLIISLAGIVLMTPSPWTIMGYLWIVSIIAIQVRLEESHLIKQHGDIYRTYASRVGRFLPGLGAMKQAN